MVFSAEFIVISVDRFNITSPFLPKSIMKSTLILLVSLATLALAENEMKCFGLKVEYISVPETCDIKAKNEKMVVIDFTVTIANGTKSVSEGREEFQIVSPTCKGFKTEVLGMCVGEKRRVVVASELDYGLTELKKMDRCSVGDHCLNQNSLKMFGYRVTQLPLDQSDLDKDTIIPGGSTLYYDIELIEAYYPPMNTMSPYFRVPHVHQFEQIFKSIDTDGDSALSREEMSVHFKKEHKSSNEDKRVEDFFNSEDKDKDGYISLEEYLDFPRDPYGSKHDEL